MKTFGHLFIKSNIFCVGFSFTAIHELICLKFCFKPPQLNKTPKLNWIKKLGSLWHNNNIGKT